MAWENLRNEIAELFSDVVADEPEAGLSLIAPYGEKTKERWRHYSRWYRKTHAQRWAENPNGHKERLRAYRAANKEKITAYKRAYRKAHLAELVAYQKAYWAANKDRLNERRRARAKGIDVQ